MSKLDIFNMHSDCPLNHCRGGTNISINIVKHATIHLLNSGLKLTTAIANRLVWPESAKLGYSAHTPNAFVVRLFAYRGRNRSTTSKLNFIALGHIFMLYLMRTCWFFILHADTLAEFQARRTDLAVRLFIYQGVKETQVNC